MKAYTFFSWIWTGLLLGLAFVLPAQEEHLFRRAQERSEQGDVLGSNFLLDQFIREHPQRLYDQAGAYFLMSYNYMQMGDYASALDCNARSLELKKRLLTDDMAENYLRYGAIFLRRGHYERALYFLSRAREYPIEDIHLYALIDGNTARVLAAMGQYGQAVQYYRQTLETLLIEAGDDHPEVADTYYRIGVVYQQWGKAVVAKEYLDKALVLVRVFGGHPALAGQLYTALGEWYETVAPDSALYYYEEALAAHRRTFGALNAEPARVRMRLARVYFSQARWPEAREEVVAAMRSLCPADVAMEWGQLPGEPELALDRLLLAEALGLQGELLLAAGEPGADQLQLALQSSELAAGLLTEALPALADDAARFGFTDRKAAIFEPGLQAAIRLAERSAGQHYLYRAFALLEQAKTALIVTQSAPSVWLLPDQESEELRLRRGLRTAEILFAQSPLEASAQAMVRRARSSYTAFWENLKTGSPQSYRKRFGGIPVRAESLIQSGLGEKTALLSFFTGTNHYYLFCLNRKGIKAWQFPLSNNPPVPGKEAGGFGGAFDASAGGDAGLLLPMPDLSQAVQGFLLAIDKGQAAPFTHYGANLYRKLILPVEQMLEGQEELIIIPDGPLFNVPFQALISRTDPDGEARYHKSRYLMDDYAIRYAYSAAMSWDEGQDLSGAAAPELLALAPVFDGEKASDDVWDNRYIFDTLYQGSVSLRASVPDGQHFLPMAASAEEVKVIAERFNKKGRSGQSLLFAEAREEALKTLSNSPRYLHLSTHHFVNERNPALSGLALAQPRDRSTAEDGILYAPEIAWLPLEHTELVMLNGCRAASDDQGHGAGVLSLVRSFQVAGSQRVACSLWKASGRESQPFMEAFYEALLKGTTPVKALREAQRQMVRDKRTADPAGWAAFVIF